MPRGVRKPKGNEERIAMLKQMIMESLATDLQMLAVNLANGGTVKERKPRQPKGVTAEESRQINEAVARVEAFRKSERKERSDKGKPRKRKRRATIS